VRTNTHTGASAGCTATAAVEPSQTAAAPGAAGAGRISQKCIYMYTLEIIIDLPLGFPIKNVISVYVYIHIYIYIYMYIFD